MKKIKLKEEGKSFFRKKPEILRNTLDDGNEVVGCQDRPDRQIKQGRGNALGQTGLN